VNEPKTIEGRWWIFEGNSEPHFGILSYDPETGLTLETKISKSFTKNETLSSSRQAESSGLRRVIIGRDKHDKPISLLAAGPGGTSKSGGLVTITIHPWAALVGYEATSWSEARFDLCGADITLLHNWVSRSRIKVGQPVDGAQTISLERPESLEIDLPQKVRLSIWQKLDACHHRAGLKLIEDDSVEFHFQNPLPVKEPSFALPKRRAS
jgi:ApeA N-terminal domain 1